MKNTNDFAKLYNASAENAGGVPVGFPRKVYDAGALWLRASLPLREREEARRARTGGKASARVMLFA